MPRDIQVVDRQRALLRAAATLGVGLIATTSAWAINPGKASTSGVLAGFLFALVAVVLLGQLLSRLFARLGQPPVIGEVLAGIMLGPSLIGSAASEWILPPSIAPGLGAMAQLGVILYMFLIGLELDPAVMRERARVIGVTSLASIVVPMLLGALLAWPLAPFLRPPKVPFANFALFLAVAMSITAFPVLARILNDLGLTKTELGRVATACAAVNDVAAWCLLAVMVAVTQARTVNAGGVALAAVVYVGVMFLVVRPLLVKWMHQWDTQPLTRTRWSLVLVLLLLSALATEAIGIHALFGAFLLGAVIPHDSGVAKTMTEHLEHLVTVLFLPAFFAFTGMRTRIDLLNEPIQWVLCASIIIVATVGKVGGTCLAARCTGMSWRDGAILGTLMNTRGLMELIILNVGLDLGIIPPSLFAMMVLMALVTTVTTGPALRWLGVERPAPDTALPTRVAVSAVEPVSGA